MSYQHKCHHCETHSTSYCRRNPEIQRWVHKVQPEGMSLQKRILPLDKADAGLSQRVVEHEAEEGSGRPVRDNAWHFLPLAMLYALPLACRLDTGAVRHLLGLPGSRDGRLPGKASAGLSGILSVAQLFLARPWVMNKGVCFRGSEPHGQ